MIHSMYLCFFFIVMLFFILENFMNVYYKIWSYPNPHVLPPTSLYPPLWSYPSFISFFILLDVNNPLILINVPHLCLGMRPSSERKKPPSGDTLQKEWLFLTQQLSAATSSPVRDVAWKTPPKCVLKSWLVWACAGPVPITTAAVSWWVRKACCLQKRARHNPPSHPPILTFVLSLPPWYFHKTCFFLVVVLEKFYFVI